MDLKTIHEIFQNRILRIPSYQRGYSWTNNKLVDSKLTNPMKNIKGQLKDLWDDLININNSDSWHYMGLLTLTTTDNIDYSWLPNHNQLAIVDGQQRITSILILLTVIIEKAKNENILLGLRENDVEFQYLYIISRSMKAYIFGYEKDNPSDKFFRKHILKLEEIEDNSEESVYTENLRRSRLFFEEIIENHLKNSELGTDECLMKIFKTITTKLKFNEYILPKELDEFIVFETMNNRGKPLSQLEKLKNRLLYLTDKIFCIENTEEENVKLNAELDEVNKNINNAWITIYNSLGKSKTEPLDDEEFIKNHWIAYFDNYSRAEANVYANFLFDDYFNIQKVYDNQLAFKDINNYIESLQKCSIWWNKLNHPSFFEQSERTLKEAILGIHRVGFKSSFKPLLLSILTREDRFDFVKSIQLLEKYAFKIFDISNRKSNTGDSKFYSLAYSVYSNKINAEETSYEIQNFTKEYFYFDLFHNQISELFKTGKKKGFYKWSGIHYFLYQYDCYLRQKNSVTTVASKLIWEDFKNKNSIEHIYPQSACLSLEEYIDQRKQKGENVEFDYKQIIEDWNEFNGIEPNFKKTISNSLGNLLAITSSDNASFSNDKYLYKVNQKNKGSNYPNRGYQFDSISASILASENENWTPDSILNRGIKMLNFLLEFLDLDENSISENKKKELLGFENNSE